MKTKVWQVKLGNPAVPGTANTTVNIRASTMLDAVKKAGKAERELCKQMEKDDGERVSPDRPIAVRFLCELND